MRSRRWTVPIAVVVGVMTGCGGGDSGVRPGGTETPTAMPVRTPEPVEPVEPPNASTAQVRVANPSALDVGEHWGVPETLAQILNATAPHVGTAGLTAALTAVEDRSGDASSMRVISPSDMVPIGTRNGIAIGRWTDGPADTLDIDFLFHPDAKLTSVDRARVERAGKAISRHISNDFDPRTLHYEATETGFAASIQPTEKTQTYEVDDMLITVSTSDSRSASGAGGSGSPIVRGNRNFGGGLIVISTKSGHQNKPGVIVHEIAHVMFNTEPTQEGQQEPTWRRYLSEDEAHFEGPHAMTANGGEPVPFQFVREDDRHVFVEPGTPGSRVDYSHLGVCTSILAYCRDYNTVVTPGAIDLAWLKDMGYDIDDTPNAHEAEVYGYGAWSLHSAWGAGVARHLTGFEASDDRIEATADAFGVLPESDFATTAAAVGGNASWKGVLLGVDTSRYAPVTGNASLNVDLADLDGTAAFDNLTVHADGVTQAFRARTLKYAIIVEGNGFADAGGRVEGNFYGPAHQEMAGVLHDRSVSLLAGFGGVREE